MSRDDLVKIPITTKDGVQTSAWVRPSHRKVGIGAGVLAGIMVPVAAIGLSGCAPDNGAGAQEPTPGSSSSQTTTPVPSATQLPSAAPIVGDLDGNGRLDSWEKEQLIKGIYTLSDGTQVVIKSGEPLPAEVIQNVQEQIAPAASTYGNSINQPGAGEALRDSITEEETKIGRKIVAITYIDPDVNNKGWAVSNPAPIVSGGFSSKEDAIAHANQWVDGNDAYVVIVFG